MDSMTAHGPEWAHLQRRLRGLIRQTMRKYQEAYPRPRVGVEETDGHGSQTMDACTILLPYVAFARWSGDATVKEWLYTWRDAYVDVMRHDRGGFYHGFPVEGEAHHQWEDQSRFLSRLWFLDRDDPVNAYVADDAAEHIGNWSPDVPAWYDWERHDFRSYWFGTKRVAYRGGYAGAIWGDATPTPPTGIYREALYRVAQTALNAWFATGKERYLAWVRDFMDAYIRRLEERGPQEDLVHIFAIEGWPAPQHTDFFAKNGWPRPDNRFVYGRYAPALLTDLYAITGEARYANAARRFLDHCFPAILTFWHQHYFLGLLQRYRHLTGDTRHDDAVMEAIEAACARDGDFDPAQYPFHWNGVQALGFARWRGPIAHVLQYWITGEERYAVRALRQAVGMAEALLARDAQEFVEGFATAHIGGIVDQKLTNMLLNLSGWRPGMQAHHIDVMDVILMDERGREGVPEDVALLRRPSPITSRVFALCNMADTERTLRVAAGDLRQRHPARVTIDGRPAVWEDTPEGFLRSRAARVTLPARSVVEIAME